MNDPKKLASKGRYGDTMLAHINPEEAALLKARGGSGTINPKTGLPEFYGQWQMKQMEEQKKAEAEAAAAAAKKKAAASAPAPALTPAQRQANMARDLALSQTRGARPSGQDSQFYQPAYQSQYQNYGNPLTAFNVSNYGTNPAMSRSMRDATAPGAGGAGDYYKHLQSYASLFGTQPDNNNINFDTLLKDMQRYGISAQDLQNASSYNPAPSGVGGGGNKTQQYVDPSTGRSTGLADIPQMQTPFSYQQPMQQRQASFNPYTNNFGATGGAFPTQTPFSYQTATGKQSITPLTASATTPFTSTSTPFNYQTTTGQPNRDYGLAYSKPMQLPQYVYDTIRDVDSYQSQPVQAYQSTRPVLPTSSGPSKAIVGRSSQVRGTPNVMAAPVVKAKGGIASLLKKHK